MRLGAAGAAGVVRSGVVRRGVVRSGVAAPASGRKTAGAGCVVNPLPGMDGFQDGILSLIDRGASVLDGELGIGIGFAVAGSSLRCLAVVIGLLSVGVVFTLCN